MKNNMSKLISEVKKQVRLSPVDRKEELIILKNKLIKESKRVEYLLQKCESHIKDMEAHNENNKP